MAVWLRETTKLEYPCSVFFVPFRILRRSVFLAAFRILRRSVFLAAFRILSSVQGFALRILPAPFVCTSPYFSSEQWDCENSDVWLRRGEEKEGANGERSFFSDTEAILYVVNRGAKCLRSSARLNRRNCRTKPATCNASAEQKSNNSTWRSFLIDRICQGRIWYAQPYQ